MAVLIQARLATIVPYKNLPQLMKTMVTILVLLLFVASCSYALPGGSSFGGVYEMKKSNSSSSSDYAFIFEDDSFLEQFRNGFNEYFITNRGPYLDEETLFGK